MNMCSSDFPGNIDASAVPHPPIARMAGVHDRTPAIGRRLSTHDLIRLSPEALSAHSTLRSMDLQARNPHHTTSWRGR